MKRDGTLSGTPKHKTFDVDPSRMGPMINIFRLRDKYVFKHYFKERELYTELSKHYNTGNYRFEIRKEEELDQIIILLEKHGYQIGIIQEPAQHEFTVKISRYKKHAPILKKAVDVFDEGDDRIMVLKDRVSVEEALGMGAEKLE